MPEYLRSTMILNESMAAGGSRRVDDLPVNPLSFILLTLRALNSAANAEPSLTSLLATISSLEVLYRGSAICSGSLADLAMISALRAQWYPAVQPRSKADNSIIRVSVPILLGRKPYDMLSCYPASRRGELQLALTPAATFTDLDTLTLQVETVELIGANPLSFLKYTTISKTPSATGDHDLDLPIGNPILGVLLFGTTAPTAAATTASLATVRLLIDNQEQIFARAQWDTMHQQLSHKLPPAAWMHDHIHRSDLASVYTQHQDTAIGAWDLSHINNYAFVDFDPMPPEDFSLQTAGRSRIHLRITADVADAIRVLPVELISTGAAPTT